MLVVPPELLLYIATSSEEKYVYNVAGPAGPAKFEAGVAGYEARAFRGCGVVTSTPFEISDDADSLQMLQRNTQVGEFYRMRAPSIGWEGSPFGPKREVSLRLFAQGPLRQCAICAARGKIAGPQTDPKQMASGGDHRHCCRRQWKYAADNYFIRELTG